MRNKTGLIISREYSTRVKKKSFLLITILVPVVIIAFYAVIIGVAMSGSSKQQRIAVVDDAGLLADTAASKNNGLFFMKDKKDSSFMKTYKQEGYDAFLYIPVIDIDSPKNIVMYTAGSASLSMVMSLESKINKAIESRRVKALGINAAAYDKVASSFDLPTVDTDHGNKKSVAGLAYGVSFVCGILIYMMMIIYGTQVMRGVMEEKTNRIAEVVISSVKPFQLMTGKIIGIGAVGLTQFAIWILLMVFGQMLLPLLVPGFMEKLNSMSAGGGAATVLEGLNSLPLLKIACSFLFYFIGGYLTYAALFAAIGSMATDDQQDTQQLIFPVLMPIILGFVIMTKAAADPQSSLAVFGSLFPLTSPIVMMGRITSDVPSWQMAASVILLIGCFLFLTWLTGRIYRTGILMYGKKPKWKEMIKWAIRG